MTSCISSKETVPAQDLQITKPSPVPTFTSTPVGPLSSHNWSQTNPLITFGDSGGDGNCGFLSVLPSPFILYPNGELFISDWNSTISGYEISHAELSKEEVCNLLNSIDQAGFFEYDPSTYIDSPDSWIPPVFGAGKITITIEGWQTNSVSLYGLDYFIQEMETGKAYSGCLKCNNTNYPTILPAIKNTFVLLRDYRPEQLTVYDYERLGVWIDKSDLGLEPTSWPILSIDLEKYIAQEGKSSTEPNIILTGQNAQKVYNLMGNSIQQCGINFIQNGEIYRVFARPLLPDEFTSSTSTQPYEFSCSPSDGYVSHN